MANAGHRKRKFSEIHDNSSSIGTITTSTSRGERVRKRAKLNTPEVPVLEEQHDDEEVEEGNENVNKKVSESARSLRQKKRDEGSAQPIKKSKSKSKRKLLKESNNAINNNKEERVPFKSISTTLSASSSVSSSVVQVGRVLPSNNTTLNNGGSHKIIEESNENYPTPVSSESRQANKTIGKSSSVGGLPVDNLKHPPQLRKNNSLLVQATTRARHNSICNSDSEEAIKTLPSSAIQSVNDTGNTISMVAITSSSTSTKSLTISSKTIQQQQQLPPLQQQVQPYQPPPQPMYASTSFTVSMEYFPVLVKEDDGKELLAAYGDSLRKKDELCLPENFLSCQNFITKRMRAVLFDWMTEVSQEYLLRRQTLYYAMNYVDRFLSLNRDVKTCKLQLVGVTALSIASKIEEIYPPAVQAFSNTTDGAFDIAAIQEMETAMLTSLNWTLSPSTHYTWMLYYLHYLSSSSEGIKNLISRDNLSQQKRINNSFNSSSTLSSIERNNKESKVCQLYPTSSFPSALLIKAMEVVDLCVLDYKSTQFKCGLLSAAVLYALTDNHKTIQSLSGHDDADIAYVRDWVVSRYSGLPPNHTPHTKWNQIVRDVPRVDWHTLQTYNEHALSHINSIEEREARVEEEDIDDLLVEEEEFEKEDDSFFTPPPNNPNQSPYTENNQSNTRRLRSTTSSQKSNNSNNNNDNFSSPKYSTASVNDEVESNRGNNSQQRDKQIRAISKSVVANMIGSQAKEQDEEKLSLLKANESL